MPTGEPIGEMIIFDGAEDGVGVWNSVSCHLSQDELGGKIYPEI
jgi:hypothetical protein